MQVLGKMGLSRASKYFSDYSENNMACLGANWRGGKIRYKLCTNKLFFLSFLTEPGESSCGIQSQGIVRFL